MTGAWTEEAAVELEKWTDMGLHFESEPKAYELGIVVRISTVLVSSNCVW